MGGGGGGSGLGVPSGPGHLAGVTILDHMTRTQNRAEVNLRQIYFITHISMIKSTNVNEA